MEQLGLLGEVLTWADQMKAHVLDFLGPLAGVITGAGQIFGAAIALFLLIAGKTLWVPAVPQLSDFAARISGVIAGIGIAYLYITSLDRAKAPNLMVPAALLIGGGTVAALLYMFLRLVLCFHCKEDPKLYVLGLRLQDPARRVLRNQFESVPEQYKPKFGPPPTNSKEYFCKSGKESDFIWQPWSVALAQVILVLSYICVMVPLTTGLTSASIALTQAQLHIAETPATTSIDLPTDILFDFNDATIRAGASYTMENVVSNLREHGVRVAHINGYTDSKGSPAYNQKLSADRAEAVRKWLITRGRLNDVAFTVQGFGATKPLAPNTKDDGSDDPEGRQINRRVEIVIDKREAK